MRCPHGNNPVAERCPACGPVDRPRGWPLLTSARRAAILAVEIVTERHGLEVSEESGDYVHRDVMLCVYPDRVVVDGSIWGCRQGRTGMHRFAGVESDAEAIAAAFVAEALLQGEDQ